MYPKLVCIRTPDVLLVSWMPYRWGCHHVISSLWYLTKLFWRDPSVLPKYLYTMTTKGRKRSRRHRSYEFDNAVAVTAWWNGVERAGSATREQDHGRLTAPTTTGTLQYNYPPNAYWYSLIDYHAQWLASSRLSDHPQMAHVRRESSSVPTMLVIMIIIIIIIIIFIMIRSVA